MSENRFIFASSNRDKNLCKGSAKLSGGATPLAVSPTLKNGRLERGVLNVGGGTATPQKL